MSGSRSRSKGARGEREACAVLGEWLGETFTRNLEQSRDGGGDCIQISGYCLEVKRCETLRINAWWKQAIEQASHRRVEPVLMFRQSRKPWRVLLKSRYGPYREVSVEEFAGEVREKWARLYGIHTASQ
jgi:hypothetical protein